MSFLKSLVVLFLAFLGGVKLVDEIAERINRPARWVSLDRSRRSFFMLAISIIGGATASIGGWFRSKRDKVSRQLLVQLDVRLLQLDGLVATALGAEREKIPYAAMAKVMEYIGDYWRRTRNLVRELQPYLEEREFQSMTVFLQALQHGSVQV